MVVITSHNKKSPVVYVISDSLGETAEIVARAATSQFNADNIEVRRIPYMNDPVYLEEILQQAALEPSVIVYTLVLESLAKKLVSLAAAHHIPTVDILGPMIAALEQVSPSPPRMEPGLLHKLDEQYFRKVEAMEFAVKYDDGKDPRGLLYADVVLIGVSRTSKTPVSMYLAHKRIKTANLSLVPEAAPPEELYRLPPRRVIGLTIDPQLLNEIRQNRLSSLGLASDAEYTKMERILKELDYAREIMKRIGCPVVDVTNRAIEETAGKVLELYYRGERQQK